MQSQLSQQPYQNNLNQLSEDQHKDHLHLYNNASQLQGSNIDQQILKQQDDLYMSQMNKNRNQL